MKRNVLFILCICGLSLPGWAASDMAPEVPDLSLPMEDELQSVPMVDMQEALNNRPQPAPVKKVVTSRKHTRKSDETEIAVTMKDLKNDEVMVEKMNPVLPPIKSTIPVEEKAPAATAQSVPAAADQSTPAPDAATQPAAAEQPAPAAAAEATPPAAAKEEFAPARENQAAVGPQKELKVVYNPGVRRDPTLSPDDTLLIRHREEERLRAIEAEKQRKIEEERKRLAELERQRQLELERLRDPSREIRGRIHISGIIGQEVFIGDKVYTVGKSVLGARIISVQPDSVVFQYKGQKFTKKVQLQ